MAKGFDFIGLVIAAPETERSDMLSQMATMTPVTVESLQEELAKRLVATAANRKATAAKVIRDKRNAAIEAVKVLVEAIRDDNEALVSVFDTVSELEGQIVLSGFELGAPTYTVLGLKTVTRGGTGGGKPAAVKDKGTPAGHPFRPLPFAGGHNHPALRQRHP